MWRTLLQVCSLLIVAILESSCGGGRSTIPASAPHSTVPAPTLLRTLYRVVNVGDWITKIGPDERISYPLQGKVYYVPDQPASGRTTLNRLINSGGTDHADAINNLMGYSQDMVLGFPWTGASGLGMAQLSEFLNSGTGDYALLAPSESLPGYSPQALAVYGYPRFGNASEVLLSLSAGGITVESNKVAGGVVWRWFWNGVEFENNFAYGGEIQAAFYVGDNPNLNPTEAGDFYGRENPILAHGSPVVRFENQGNTDHTCRPAQLGPDGFRRRSGPPGYLGQRDSRKGPHAQFQQHGSCGEIHNARGTPRQNFRQSHQPNHVSARKFQSLLDLRCAIPAAERSDRPHSQRLLK